MTEDIKARIMLAAHDMIATDSSGGLFDVKATGTLQNGWTKLVQNTFGKDAAEVAELQEMWTAAQFAVAVEVSDTAMMDALAEALATGKPMKPSERTLVSDLQSGEGEGEAGGKNGH